MRIAHVITRLLRAGSEENTLLTAAGQIAAGHDVSLMHGPKANIDFARHMAPGINLIEIPALERELSPAADIQAFLQIRSHLRRLKPDVIHTHQSKAGIVGRLAAAAAGTPTIIHGVHILPFLEEAGVRRGIYLNAERLTARSTDGFIHVSEAMMSACLEEGVGSGRIHRVVHSGFDLQRFALATPPEDWRTLLGVADGAPKPPTLVMLAALERRKQHLKLIEYLPALMRHYPEVRVVLAGEGELKATIAERIAALGLETNVRLLGYRSDAERIIAMADICLLCSQREGLPRSVMQYLAGGRPPVVLRVAGIEQLVRNGDNGLVFGQDDWDGYISSLLKLISDAKARARMASRARETNLSSWDATRMATRTLEVYDEVLSCTRGARAAASHRLV